MNDANRRTAAILLALLIFIVGAWSGWNVIQSGKGHPDTNDALLVSPAESHEEWNAEPKVIWQPRAEVIEQPPSSGFRKDSIESPDNLDRFGKWRWPGIANKELMVIVGGKYVEPPYVIETTGLGIYLNSNLVEWVEWPPPEFLSSRPSPPHGLTKYSTPTDLLAGSILESWPDQIHRWARSHFTLEQVPNAVAAAYAELPFVKRTWIETITLDANDLWPGDDGTRKVYWLETNTGEKFRIPITSSSSLRPRSVSDVTGKLRFEVAALRHQLEGKGLLWRDRSRSARCDFNSRAWQKLPEFFDIIHTERANTTLRDLRLRALFADWRTPDDVPLVDSIGSLDFFAAQHCPGFQNDFSGMIDRLATDLEWTPALQSRLKQIQDARPSKPNDTSWVKKLPRAVTTENRRTGDESRILHGPEHVARETLADAVDEMIRLLERKEFDAFVDRYIPQEDRDHFRGPEGNTLAKLPEFVGLQLTRLKLCRNRSPQIANEHGASLLFWPAEHVPMEATFLKIGRFWYFGGARPPRF